MKLNDRMEFDHVIRVHADGSITEADGVYAPEVNIDLDSDGQIVGSAEQDMIDSVSRAGWELMTGYTGQYSYSGPIMHPSEYIGGDLAKDIMAAPGFYVAVEVRGLLGMAEEDMTDDDHATEDAPIGWVVARRDAAYRIETSESVYDTESCHDGDRGPAVRESSETEDYADYDADDDFGNYTGVVVTGPVSWAIRVLRPRAAFEPSQSPVPDALPEHAWLSANRETDNYTSLETETSVRLTGDWTPAERAEVFRAVTSREVPAQYTDQN